MRDVLDPVNTFNNFVRNWWQIFVFAVVGGLLGLTISFALPPKYEAEAIFSTSIDFTQINFDKLVGNYGEPVVWTQYEEDLVLQVVERMLLKQFNPALRFARTLDPTFGRKKVMKHWSPQKKQAKQSPSLSWTWFQRQTNR